MLHVASMCMLTSQHCMKMDVIISNIKYKLINNLQLLLNCGQFLYGSHELINYIILFRVVLTHRSANQ